MTLVFLLCHLATAECREHVIPLGNATGKQCLMHGLLLAPTIARSRDESIEGMWCKQGRGV